LSACFRLVEAGLGIAALPKRLGQEYVARGSIEEFDPGWVPGPLRFTVSFVAEPRSQVVSCAAEIARQTALEFASHKNL